MKILFVARHHGYFKNYESVLRQLAKDGHTLHLAAERDEDLGGRRIVDTLAAEFPSVTYGAAPSRADDEWSWVAGRVRLGLDYLRYQHPVFDRASQLRLRARERTPGAFVALGRVAKGAGWLRRACTRALRNLERAVPDDPGIRRFVEAQRPDLLLLTPLIDLGSSQIDYLRSARLMGVPTALCVWSWDHLSSKALLREQPDRVFVWNDVQRQEAIELHGVDPSRIVVTGAQCFDQWFDREPSRDRQAFCRDVGLDPARPIVLYVCSALFAGSPSEAAFVVTWLQRLRTVPELRHAQVLIRPHPSRTAEWVGIDVRPYDAVVWGSNPVDDRARADYFDSLYYSAAVVGINTSAFIEAGILGRPVHAIVVPEFSSNQMGTVHFQYLVDVAGGLVILGHGLDDHLARLRASLDAAPGAPRPFVEAFLRPRGLTHAATPFFVEQVEAMHGMTPSAPPLRAGTFWTRALAALAATRDRRHLERLTLSVRERESVEHARDEQQRKAFRRAEERAASDPKRLEALRARMQAFEDERRRRAARRQRSAAATLDEHASGANYGANPRA